MIGEDTLGGGRESDESRYLYERLHRTSRALADRMVEAWRRPVRHNRRIERAALWHGLSVDIASREALAAGDDVMLPRCVEPSYRYDLQASLFVVQRGLPLSTQERARLSGRWSMSFLLERYEFSDENEVGDGVSDREPELVERWHHWLWPAGTEGRLPMSDDFGQAAVVAESAERLAVVTRQILGR